MIEFKNSTIPTEYFGAKVCDCDSPLPFETESTIICKQCGIDLSHIYGQVYDDSPCRAYNIDERQKRTTNEVVKNKFLTRTVIVGHTDYSGKQLDAKAFKKFNQMNRVDTFYGRNSLARNMNIINNKLFTLNQQHIFPSYILDDTKKLMKKVIELKLLKGRSLEVFICACLYHCCLKNNRTTTFEEVIGVFNIEKRLFFRAYNIIKNTFKCQVKPNKKECIDITKKIYTDYINKFSISLNLQQSEISQLVTFFDKIYNKININGKSRIGVVAGFMYIFCKKLKYKVTQRNLADICNITEVTIRNSAKYFNQIACKV